MVVGPQPIRKRQLWSDGGASWWSTMLSLMTEWACCTRRLAQPISQHPGGGRWQAQRTRVTSDLLRWSSLGTHSGQMAELPDATWAPSRPRKQTSNGGEGTQDKARWVLDLGALAAHIRNCGRLPLQAVQRMVDSVAHVEAKAVAKAMRSQMRRMDDWVAEQNSTGGAALYRWINPKKTRSRTAVVDCEITSDPVRIVGAKRRQWSVGGREQLGHPPAP